jgi:HSP20 family molecular chaperone IbpA
MNTIQRSLEVLVLLGAAGSTTARDFDDLFNTIHNQIKQTQDEIEKLFDKMPSMDVKIIGNKQEVPTITENDTQVFISMKLPDVDSEKINVTKLTDNNGEYLLAKIPQHEYKTEITITTNMINSTTKRETEEQETRDGKQAAYYTYGTSNYIQTLPCEVSLQDIKAEYNDDEKVLTITLQKTKPLSSQTIPVIKK